MVADVSEPAGVQRLFDLAADRFGRVDVLFNNAGRGAPPVPLEEVSFADWLVASGYCVRLFATQLRVDPGVIEQIRALMRAGATAAGSDLAFGQSIAGSIVGIVLPTIGLILLGIASWIILFVIRLTRTRRARAQGY